MRHGFSAAPWFAVVLQVAVAGEEGGVPPARAGDRLSFAEFVEPPVESRPGCFWAWLNGSITPAQITCDLEAMKQAGMRGGEIWDVAAHADPDGRVPAGPPFLGPESTRLIVHAIREADRLGLELGLVASSGWNAGGAWIPPEHAGKALYHSETTVRGPAAYEGRPPLPELPELCPRDGKGDPLYLREVALLAVPEGRGEVVDLTARVDDAGILRWDVPAGEWTILRFVCTNHGQQLIVPSPGSGGPMIDFFDPAATEFHLRHITSMILRELGRDTFEGTSFRTIEFDSMELDGFTPWSGDMAAEFERHAGYPILRFLPVLAGRETGDAEEARRFLHDWKKFLSDRLIEAHYGEARTFLAPLGVKLVAEAGGPGPPIWPSNPVDGIKALGAVDVPRGEFWMRHRGIFLVKEIASAAHVYDKRLAEAEAFTTWRRWVDGPLNHKELADRALCEGLNAFALHTFASTPPEAGLPGWAYHAGTDINPAATWWPMAGGFMDYLARCSHLLRQGWFVADVCYFYGGQAPNFFPPEAYVPDRPRLDGLAPGHDFDVCSADVILERMSVKHGRITLPDGMNYAALVLPEQDTISAAVLEKVRELVADGATVIAHRCPTGAPGLRDAAVESNAVRRLADELWGAAGEGARIGTGRFIVTPDRTAALRGMGIGPDFEVVGRDDPGPLDFIHRVTGDADIYFVRNKTREAVSLPCRFRVRAEAAELWWPHSGERTACRTKPEGDFTEATLDLPPLGSVFVVFWKSDVPARGEPDPVASAVFEPAAEPAPQRLDGPWQVAFPAGWGAPAEATFDKLASWTESDDEGIRFFSGLATYRKTFELSGRMMEAKRLFLELGDLAEIADVRLNGEPLGTVWQPPFRVEITAAARAGTNELEIRVANLWANRLNGDSLLPESERFTRGNLDRIQTDPTSDSSFGRVPKGPRRPVYTDHPPLMRSGLFGPVRIVAPLR